MKNRFNAYLFWGTLLESFHKSIPIDCDFRSSFSLEKKISRDKKLLFITAHYHWILRVCAKRKPIVTNKTKNKIISYFMTTHVDFKLKIQKMKNKKLITTKSSIGLWFNCSTIDEWKKRCSKKIPKLRKTRKSEKNKCHIHQWATIRTIKSKRNEFFQYKSTIELKNKFKEWQAI